MDNKLVELVELARKRPITKDELRLQREAFAYGNLSHDSRTTREEVKHALELMDGE